MAKRKTLPKLSIMAICNEFDMNYYSVWQDIQLGEKPSIPTEKKAAIKKYLDGKNKEYIKLLGLD